MPRVPRQAVGNGAVATKQGYRPLPSTIPDSGDLHARYSAKELSLADGDSVSTWGDATGNGHDLTAGTAPTYVASGINGYPTVRFDGVDDFLDVAWGVVGQPFHVYVVAQKQSGVTDSSEYLFDGEANDSRLYSGNNAGGNTWNLYAGSVASSGVTEDSNPHILGSLFDAASSKVRIDGVDNSTGDPGANGLNGFTVGSDDGQVGYGDFDVGEILVYPMDKSAIESDIDQYLDSEWGPIL